MLILIVGWDAALGGLMLQTRRVAEPRQQRDEGRSWRSRIANPSDKDYHALAEREEKTMTVKDEEWRVSKAEEEEDREEEDEEEEEEDEVQV
ncbi:hypothetical protein HL42_8238 [Trichophyton rubrum]|nr:hypothetical protein HL42_8238 [Trichophyton rubrum]